MSFLAMLADILFVGHSLVGPTLPNLVEAGLNARGMPVEVSAQIINGAPLSYNWENSHDAQGEDSRAVLGKGQTKILILTEGIPLANQVEWNDSVGHVAKFADLAWQARPDTEVFIYETWHSLKSGTGEEIEFDPDGSRIPWRDRITADLPVWESLAEQANANRPDEAPKVRLIPAGQAMGELADAIEAGEVPGISSLQDLFGDDIHPNSRGFYFLALVHIAVITGQSPEGLPTRLGRTWDSRAAVLTDEQAAALQRIAWRAVDRYQKRLAGIPPPGAPESVAAASADSLPLIVPDGPAEISNPRLAFNLNGVTDWSVQLPFLDIFKSARPWVARSFEGDDVSYEALKSGGHLTAEGWPLVPPEGAGIFVTHILTDLPEDIGGAAGSYVLRYAGKGKVTTEGLAQNPRYSPGRINFDFTPGPGNVIIAVSDMDPTDPIRDISVVRADREAALDAGEVFNPDWLNRIRGASGLRFMDWMATNSSRLSTAADRPRRSDFSWAVQGVPMEVMIALANGLKAEPWFTLPHLADDELIQVWAEEVRDGLSPDLRVHLEFSNEVWNWSFSQSAWADEQALARWSQEDAWVQFYALRASQAADIWTGVFGDEARTRLNRVIAVQTGWLGLEEKILNAPLVIDEGNPAPATNFDSYAITGYFAASLGSEEKADLLRDWLQQSLQDATGKADAEGLSGADRDAFIARHRFDLATDLAIRELENGVMSGDTRDTLSAFFSEILPYHARVARENNLKLVMYEGGTHVVGLGSQMDNDELNAFFQHLNYSPAMGALYERVQEGWADLTDAPFTAFNDVSYPSKWGSWGALRHLTDDNPRWRALAEGCPAC
ncbi:MAG: hypothetical protein ACK5M4_15675 [Pseudorhodobacter sp.]